MDSSHQEGWGEREEGGAGSKRQLPTPAEFRAQVAKKKKEVGVPSTWLKSSRAEGWEKKMAEEVRGGKQRTLSFSQPKGPELILSSTKSTMVRCQCQP